MSEKEHFTPEMVSKSGSEISPETGGQKNLERFRGIIKNSDVLFVLAHGAPPEDKLQMQARFRVLAAVEANKLKPDMPVAFVGGHLEDTKLKSTSNQMREYFEQRASESAKAEALDASNNTVGNLEEIAKYMEGHPELKRFSIMSSQAHLDRVAKLLEQSRIKFDLVPSEPFVDARSSRHKALLKEFEASPRQRVERGINRLMILYARLDPGYSLVKGMRTLERGIKSKFYKT